MVRPSAIPGRISDFCASLPASRSAVAPTTTVGTNGDVTKPRPNCSISKARSACDPPRPPCSSGKVAASQPSSANCAQIGSSLAPELGELALALLERVILLAEALEAFLQQPLFFGERGQHDLEAEHGFGDDVALDLVRPGVDQRLAEIEIGQGAVLAAPRRLDVHAAFIAARAERSSRPRTSWSARRCRPGSRCRAPSAWRLPGRLRSRRPA